VNTTVSVRRARRALLTPADVISKRFRFLVEIQNDGVQIHAVLIASTRNFHKRDDLLSHRPQLVEQPQATVCCGKRYLSTNNTQANL
jgi:hypothetical protein